MNLKSFGGTENRDSAINVFSAFAVSSLYSDRILKVRNLPLRISGLFDMR